MNEEYLFSQEEIDNGKVLAGIAYFGIIGFLIAFLAGKQNKYTVYHAQQSLIIGIAMFLVAIPVLGWFIWLAALILSIIGLINGFSGKVKPLPVVGELFYKLNFIKPGDYRN